MTATPGMAVRGQAWDSCSCSGSMGRRGAKVRKRRCYRPSGEENDWQAEGGEGKHDFGVNLCVRVRLPVLASERHASLTDSW